MKDSIHFPAREDDTPFTYSDGEEFEQRIADIIASAKDKSLFSREIVEAAWDWRSGCHLAPMRANLLRPLEGLLKGRVLELGAGCGIITRYLGELGAEVVALEASPFRAGILRNRTVDLANVSVVCERIEAFDAVQKFDAVTMVGVLQYARMFSDGLGELDLLRSAAEQIKPDGVIMIAIQNRLGLKYFAGFPEANVGERYFGIEDRYRPTSVVRFGLNELRERLADVGLKHSSLFFPMPDYHMPSSVLSEQGMEADDGKLAAQLLALSVGQDRLRPDWRRPTFSLERAWPTILRNGLGKSLANAFLIVAGRSAESLAPAASRNDLAWHYSTRRHGAFAVGSHFKKRSRQIEVQRARVTQVATPSLPIVQKLTAEPYVVGDLWWMKLVEILNEPDWTADDIVGWARPWIEVASAKAGVGVFSQETMTSAVDGALFDATPTNWLQRSESEFEFFDQEWSLQTGLSLGYLIFRGLFGSLSLVSSCAEPKAGTPVCILDIVAAIFASHGVDLTPTLQDEFLRREIGVQGMVMNGVEKPEDELFKTHFDFFRLVSLDVRRDQHSSAGENAKKSVVELTAALIAKDDRIATISNELSLRSNEKAAFEGLLADHRNEIAALQDAIKGRIGQQAVLENQLASGAALTIALQRDIAAHVADIAMLNQQLENFQTVLAAKDEETSQLRSALSEVAALQGSLAASLAELEQSRPVRLARYLRRLKPKLLFR